MPTFAEARTSEINRHVLVRMLTFWLRPDFVLRVVSRFQKVAGFDRSMALASGALTSLIPLVILSGTVLGSDAADRIINRYRLTGEGAEAVRSVFSGDSTSGGVGVFGVLFLAISTLSFARATQRLFESTWELSPLGVRNTRNNLWWILTLGCYMAIVAGLYVALGRGRLGLAAAACEVPVTAVFLVWSGYVLSARRLQWPTLFPFGIIAALLAGAYSLGATFYLPRLFNSHASRYGAAGAVFAMISALFLVMLVLVASAALGREVRDELIRIRDGKRPSQDEIQRQWGNVVEQTRLRWRTAWKKQVSREQAHD